jgi:transposase
MMKSFKFRLYPTSKQVERLQKMLDQHRWIYNEMLACRKAHWELDFFDYNYLKQAKWLTQQWG